MSRSEVEQTDLEKGYTYIESLTAIVGAGSIRKVLIPGGKHPKMRMLVSPEATELAAGTGPAGPYSFVIAIAFTATGHQMEVIHGDGAIAGEAGANTATNKIMPFVKSGADPALVFEADEDILIHAGTAGNAATVSLVSVKFEEVK